MSTPDTQPPLPGPISDQPAWTLRRIGIGALVGGLVLSDVFLRDVEGWMSTTAAALTLALIATGVLLLFRIRWAPEMLAAVCAGYVLLFVVAMGMGGDVEMLGLYALVFAFGLVWLYPRSRRAMREMTASLIPDLSQK